MTRLGQQLLQAAVLAAIATGMGVGGATLQNSATAQHATVEVPIFEVDPLWPKPLPNEGLLGMAIGVSVDAQDNVWMVHRSSQTLHNQRKRCRAQSADRGVLSGARLRCSRFN